EEEDKTEAAGEEAEQLEGADEDTEEENTVSYSPLSPQMSSSEQVPEQNKTEETWLWDWLSPFSLFLGLNTQADRATCRSEPKNLPVLFISRFPPRKARKRLPGNMCPECEILFCRKCEVLHYNQGFIEHCILGH
uniref:DUF4637 domain-containing protein n=1 Tax=Pelodiscus sinensis TaxID=13735 RepID=K7G5G4_PELSI